MPVFSPDQLHIASTSATATIRTGQFGGYFANARAANVMTLDKTGVDDELGPRFTLGVTHEVVGGHQNGPDHTRAAIWGLAYKANWLITDKPGEVDVAYFEVRQGLKDDAGGLIIDAAKVFGEGSTGGLTPIELASARVNTDTKLVTSKVRAIVGFQEGVGGALEGNGASYYAEAEAGSPTAGVAIVNYAGTFTHAIAAYSARDPSTRYYSLRYSSYGETIQTFGSPTNNMSMLYHPASDAMYWRNETNTDNLASLTNTGEFSAFKGMRVANGSVLVKRQFATKVSWDFPSIPAQDTAYVDVAVPGAIVDDFAHVNGTTNYANDKIFFTARVISANVVRIKANNFGPVAIDPATQDLIIWVMGV